MVMYSCAECDLNLGDNQQLYVEHMSNSHEQQTITCTLCDFQAPCGAELAWHTIEQHSSDTDSKASSSLLSTCPLCEFCAEDAESVQVHFEVVHEQSTATSDSGAQSKCPVCDMALAAHLLDDHVHAHFLQNESSQSASSNATGDAELLRLRRRFGLDSGGGNYQSQGTRSLEQQFYRGQLTSDEFHEGRQRLGQEQHAGFDATRPTQDGRVQMPSVPRLQRMIEESWSAGFDTFGAEQLEGTLVNTRKWIGTTEVAALLNSMRIQTEIVEFHRANDQGMHPALLEWLWTYFDRQPNDMEAFRSAVYIQHEGHSRTVVGVEQHNNGSLSAFVLDPSHRAERMQLLLQSHTPPHLNIVRNALHRFNRQKYQLVVVRYVMNNAEMEDTKRHFRSLKVT